MTTTEELPPVEERFTLSGIGWVELEAAVARASNPDKLAELLGIKGLSQLIALVLTKHYPADIFPPGDKQYGVAWRADMDYGPGLDPGVKWINLLRMALEEVAGAE